MYCTMAVIVSAVVFSTMRSGSMLSVKNVSLNRSHEELRSAMDRLANNLRMARNVPTLLTAGGAVVATGPAAGIRFDRIIGEPYAIDPVNTAGSIASTATTLNVYRSTSVSGPPPIPKVGEILLIDTPSGLIRARITGVSASSPSGGVQRFTLVFASALGKSLSWIAGQPQWARLVRQEAFIVVPVGARNELRYYPAFDPVPNLSDRSKYSLITNEIGTGTGDGTPFEIADVSGDKVLRASIRIMAQDHSRWLASRQANEMNSYFRMNLSLTSRLRPKTTN